MLYTTIVIFKVFNESRFLSFVDEFENEEEAFGSAIKNGLEEFKNYKAILTQYNIKNVKDCVKLKTKNKNINQFYHVRIIWEDTEKKDDKKIIINNIFSINEEEAIGCSIKNILDENKSKKINFIDINVKHLPYIHNIKDIPIKLSFVENIFVFFHKIFNY